MTWMASVNIFHLQTRATVCWGDTLIFATRFSPFAREALYLADGTTKLVCDFCDAA